MKTKKIITIISMTLILTLLLLGCAPQASEELAPVVMQETDQSALQLVESTLSVNATETVTVEPDIAYLYISVRTSEVDAVTSQQANSQITEDVMAALKGLGVAEDDIKTENVYMYEDNYDGEISFVVDNSFKVTIRDVDSVGSVIDAATAAGATTSGSLNFDISNRDEVYLEALGIAMQAVDAKAKTVAEAGGYSIVRPQSISESGTSSMYPEVYANEMVASADVGGGTQVEPSEIEVSATVSGIYVIQ